MAPALPTPGQGRPSLCGAGLPLSWSDRVLSGWLGPGSSVAPVTVATLRQAGRHSSPFAGEGSVTQGRIKGQSPKWQLEAEIWARRPECLLAGGDGHRRRLGRCYLVTIGGKAFVKRLEPGLLTAPRASCSASGPAHRTRGVLSSAETQSRPGFSQDRWSHQGEQGPGLTTPGSHPPTLTQT